MSSIKLFESKHIRSVWDGDTQRWLAKVGYERPEEIEDPELAAKRMRELYQAKGYSDEWIEKRVRGIAIRDELTNEWQKRGVKQQREYAILTAEISPATFGMSPAEDEATRMKRADLLRQTGRCHSTTIHRWFNRFYNPKMSNTLTDRDVLVHAYLRKGTSS